MGLKKSGVQEKGGTEQTAGDSRGVCRAGPRGGRTRIKRERAKGEGTFYRIYGCVAPRKGRTVVQGGSAQRRDLAAFHTSLGSFDRAATPCFSPPVGTGIERGREKSHLEENPRIAEKKPMTNFTSANRSKA